MATKMHIKQTDIANQTPGYSPKAYLGVVAEMSAVPAATEGVVSTDITFTVTTPLSGFRQVYNLPKSQSASSSTVGEAGGLSSNFMHTLFIPGDKATINAALKTYLNQPLIVLAQDGEEGGPVWMYGTLQNPAYIDAKSFESGTLADGKKGYTVNIFAKNKYSYTGTINEMAV